MILQAGYVAIRPWKQETVRIAGMVLHDNINPARWVQVYGTIEAVSPVMRYHGRFIWKEKPNRSVDTMEDLADLRSISLDRDVPVEVCGGDVVLFNYMATLKNDHGMNAEQFYDGMLIVPYSALIARVDPGFELYPLNGMVFLRMHREPKRTAGMVWKKVDEIQKASGLVVSQGARVRHYIDDGEEDPRVNVLGRQVWFNPDYACRIEYDTVAKVKQNDIPLYSIRLRDILYYENDV